MISTDFSNLPLSRDLTAVLEELGFTELTPIQAQSLPLLLDGKDLIGQSKTGSGKTAAFALPILQKIDLELREVQALILCPTRELCAQVAREIRRLGRRLSGLQVLVVSGGQPGRLQAEALYKGVHIVVGTPGRILDHLDRETIDLADVRTLVLDEADRMLDMGFEEEMTAIMAEAPATRQTVFFSATYPATIREMSRQYQDKPVHVTIEDKEVTTPKIKQTVYLSSAEQKVETLLRIFNTHKPESAIVFCNQKLTTAELSQQLSDKGASCACLNGDLEQFDRDQVMALFRNESIRILIATDVAARGLDVENLEMVVNFDLPFDVDTYVHRIGRTGRAGKTGVAVSIATPAEQMRLREFADATANELEQGPLATPEMARERLSFEPAKMQTLMLSAGRKDKMRPGDILGALTGEAGGFSGADVGKIEIHDRFSYVAINSTKAISALQKLSAGRIKGRSVFVKLVRGSK